MTTSASTPTAAIDFKPFSCELCGLHFDLGDEFRKHHFSTHSSPKKIVHRFEPVEVKKEIDEKLVVLPSESENAKPYACNVCDDRFGAETELATHLLKHVQNCNKSYKFRCIICEAKYTNKPQLLLHMRAHSEGPIICRLCGKELRSKPALVLHYKTHLKRQSRGTLKKLQDECEKYFFCYDTFEIDSCQPQPCEICMGRDTGAYIPSLPHAKGNKLQCKLCDFNCQDVLKIVLHIAKDHDIGYKDEEELEPL